MHKDLESNPPKRDKDSMLDRRRRRFLCPGSNPKPIAFSVGAGCGPEVDEAIICGHNVDLSSCALGLNFVLRFEDFVEHALSDQLRTLGSQHLRFERIRPAKCCHYFKRSRYEDLCGTTLGFYKTFEGR